jgi:hypothetical protein
MAMAMPETRRAAPRCANCAVEIPWPPTMHLGQAYCCGGCAQGGPCYCSYDLTTLERQPAPRQPVASRPAAGRWLAGGEP